MLKSILLSKASVLTLTAVVLTSLMTPAWSMEDHPEQTDTHTITRKRNNFSKCPEALVGHLLTGPAYNLGAQNEPLDTLAGVCTDWRRLIKERESAKRSWHNGRLVMLKTTHGITDPQEKETLHRFYNGKLIYRPIAGSDDEIITLHISGLKNPLKGTFDLSSCGDTGQYLSIATGCHTGKKAKNAKKVEVWIAPRFVIARDLQGPASHFAPIMDRWVAETAPVGLFFTWGGWDNLDSYDYLTTHSIDSFSSGNLYKLWLRMSSVRGVWLCPLFEFPLGGCTTSTGITQRFHVSFGELKKD